jgi:ATP/maltotriose-dependent transcriptional regulator MalT
MALGQRGAIAIRRGDPAHGVALLDESLQVARRVGYLMVATSYMIDMAEGLIALRRTHEALATLDQATARIEASDELYLMPELLRIRGEALAQAGADEAKRTVLAAIDWARRQSAMTLEIRAMTSLTRIQIERGDAEDAAEVLASLLGRFSEGDGNPDVRAAAELLEALGRPLGPPA